MKLSDIHFISNLIVASLLLFFIPIVIGLIKYFVNKRNPQRKKRGGVKTMLIFSAFLIMATWAFRYSVGYHNIVNPPDNDQTVILKGEEVVRSLIDSMRSFGIEEEYKTHVIEVRAMADSIVDQKYAVGVANLLVVYFSVLTILAPIAGGAIILEMLASVFPKIKLMWVNLHFWRDKCYFSELNTASLALAKSIVAHYAKTGKRLKPVLIFTDTYIDDEKEKEYELLLDAKQINAICLRDDISHVAKPRFGKKSYYLIDEDEYGNMQTLANLAERGNVKYIKRSHIYLFVNSDAYVQIEKKVESELLYPLNGKGIKKSELPRIIPVNAYHNLVNNLFVDVPLYEPICNTDSSKLTVTILGNGIIGTEAFLNSYWFGQMLINGKDDCKLSVNVISKDTPDEFWSKIDYINPEIKGTVDTDPKQIHRYEGLLEYAKGENNDSYCKVKYIKADLKIGAFWESNDKIKSVLDDTDYFIVALGSDSDNISIAEKLHTYIGTQHFEEREKIKNPNTVIAYAVFDSKLCNMLNGHVYKLDEKNKKYVEKSNVFMYAFGSLDQVYSSDNVYMTKSLIWAEETGETYKKLQGNDAHISEHLRRSENESRNYTHWADLARAMHVKYKVFSLGWITSSLFDYDEKNKRPLDNEHRKNVRKLCAQYRRIASLDNPEYFNGEDKKKYDDIFAKKETLAWLEHRRWTAYTRTLGYRVTAELEENFKSEGSHKNMPLKLHPCLVEARRPKNEFILGEVLENGKIDESSTLKNTNSEDWDALDRVSYKWRDVVKAAKSSLWLYDFKMYDYYRYEFSDAMTAREFNNVNKKSHLFDKLDEKAVLKYCKRNDNNGVIRYGDDWIIPYDHVDRMLLTKYEQVPKAKIKSGEVTDAVKFIDNWYK